MEKDIENVLESSTYGQYIAKFLGLDSTLVPTLNDKIKALEESIAIIENTEPFDTKHYHNKNSTFLEEELKNALQGKAYNLTSKSKNINNASFVDLISQGGQSECLAKHLSNNFLVQGDFEANKNCVSECFSWKNLQSSMEGKFPSLEYHSIEFSLEIPKHITYAYSNLAQKFFPFPLWSHKEAMSVAIQNVKTRREAIYRALKKLYTFKHEILLTAFRFELDRLIKVRDYLLEDQDIDSAELEALSGAIEAQTEEK